MHKNGERSALRTRKTTLQNPTTLLMLAEACKQLRPPASWDHHLRGSSGKTHPPAADAIGALTSDCFFPPRAKARGKGAQAHFFLLVGLVSIRPQLLSSLWPLPIPGRSKWSAEFQLFFSRASKRSSPTSFRLLCPAPGQNSFDCGLGKAIGPEEGQEERKEKRRDEPEFLSNSLVP